MDIWKYPSDQSFNNFNHIIFDLKGVNVKTEDGDQTIILLCSLSNPYENFIDTMLLGRTTITMNDVKGYLLSKKWNERFQLVKIFPV